MGLGQDRGLTQVLGTDLLRNVASFINRLGDEIMAKTPYSGDAAANTDATGFATINHGLGFAPARILVQTRQAISPAVAWLVGPVDTITATTFRIRCMTISASSPYSLIVANALPYSIHWEAFR